MKVTFQSWIASVGKEPFDLSTRCQCFDSYSVYRGFTANSAMPLGRGSERHFTPQLAWREIICIHIITFGRGVTLMKYILILISPYICNKSVGHKSGLG